jgi:hypothetical protein
MEIVLRSNVPTAISAMLGFVRKTCMTGIGGLEQLGLPWNERLLNRRSTTPLEFGLRAYPKSGIIAVFDCSF